MSDFRDFLKMLRGQPTEAQAKALTLTLAPGGFTDEVLLTVRGGGSRTGGTRGQVDTATLERTMSLNELVYACINVKATAARDPRLLVQRQVSKAGKVEYEEIAGHPFRALFMRPNEFMTEGDLMRAAIVSWDVSNPRRFFCEKQYEAGRLVALYPLNPACMQPRYSQTGARKIIGYTWQDGSYREEYSLDELLIRSAPAWHNPPPMVAALGSTLSDTAQTEYIASFFQNGGVPSGFLKYHMPLDQPRRDEIREKWNDTYRGATGSGQIGILDENVDYQEIGSRLDQLSSNTLRSVAESRICMVFGVPPLIVYAYVGLLRATYSNLKEAWAGFWDATMSPAFKEWRDFWMWSLLIEFEDERDIRAERVRLNYDMGQVAALQDDVDKIQTRAERSFRAGGITLNEYRSALGAPNDPAGDYYLRLLSYAPQAAGQGPTVDADQVLGGKARKARKSRDDPSVQIVERKMEQVLQHYLQGQYRAAAEAIE
jgi:HK97 family phage portal protein